MHSCSRSTGDAWLHRWVPRLTRSRIYRHGSTVIFITWDEGSHGTLGESCADSSDESCIVPVVVVSPYTKRGTVSHAHYTHYSLLETMQRLLGVGPLLGHARDRSTHSLLRPFGLA
jgi:hypothetical protein